MTTLHQDLDPANGEQFIDLLIDLSMAEHVVIGVLLSAIKSAELAVNIADVRVIDVAINDIGNDLVSSPIKRFGFSPLAPVVGQLPKFTQWQSIELHGLFSRNPLAIKYPFDHS